MKNKLTVLLGVFCTSLALSAAVAPAPIKRTIAVSHVYIPYGFDSNDTSTLLLEGTFPNLCYQNPEAKVTYEGNKINIEMTATYRKPGNAQCAQLVLPFVQQVSLGILDRGNYEIVVNEGSMEEKREDLYIEEAASHAVDSYVYANVEYIEKKEDSRTVTLVGYNPSDCFQLKEVGVFNNDKDTYSITPIMEQVRAHCPMKMTPFRYEVEIPKSLKVRQALLHVRSMNGKSVNTLFNNH